jgi:hypothetical protein
MGVLYQKVNQGKNYRPREDLTTSKIYINFFLDVAYLKKKNKSLHLCSEMPVQMNWGS